MRVQQLQHIAAATHTCVLLESPKRICKTLQHLVDYAAAKEICIGREITKMHEEFISGTASELLQHFEMVRPRGEMVVMVGVSQTPIEIDDSMIEVEAAKVIYNDLAPSGKARAVAQALGVKRARVYAVLLADA